MTEQEVIERIKDLKSQKESLYNEIEPIYKQLIAAEHTFINIKHLYMEKKGRFKDLDIQLAKLDGRLKIINPRKNNQKVGKKLPFSKIEILRLAKALGIEDELKMVL